MRTISHFYVDESGDLTLFGRRGKVLLGSSGVSKCFMVGMAHLADPKKFQEDLQTLRRDLLADDYLKAIPSMQSEEGKTARCFHAKDDCPEVRSEVFKLLVRHDIKVQVGIRRKAELIKEAHLAQSLKVSWNSNHVYDHMVTTLFKGSLHKTEASVITFARRGKSSREEAFQKAIRKAKENFERDTGIPVSSATDILPTVPSESVGLQAIDYFLWALQRLYERGEDRYFNFAKKHYRLIMDFDDKRKGTNYGEWYSEQNPLTPGKILPVVG